MRIISKRPLREFWQNHPDAEEPLLAWYQHVSRADWGSFARLRESYPSADRVGRLIVFNIGGRKFRLIASVHFNSGKVYVRSVLTHAEYDRGDWKEG
jgi:mRNA interferase HigB